MPELMVGLKKYDEHMPKDPMQRPFAHLKRGEDGNFADDDLVNIMQTGIEEVAGKCVQRDHLAAVLTSKW